MQRRDELLLSEHFSEGVRRVRKSVPGAPLKVLNFDWHGMMKDLKEQATVEGLWALLGGITTQVQCSGSVTEGQPCQEIWLTECIEHLDQKIDLLLFKVYSRHQGIWRKLGLSAEVPCQTEQPAEYSLASFNVPSALAVA